MMYRILLTVVVIALPGCSPQPEDGALEIGAAPLGAAPLAGAAVRATVADVPAPALQVEPALADRLSTEDIPVLLPRAPHLRRDTFVTSGPGWVSVSMKGQGLHLSVLARTRAEVRPALARQVPPCDGECVRTSRSDAITSVAFQRYGVAYLLDVECERAAADPRCADEAFALGVYEELALAGGGQ